MNQLKPFFLNSIVFCLMVAAIGFLSGRTIENYAHQTPDVATYAQDLEQALHQAEEEIEGLFNNGSFLLNAVEGYVLGDTIQKYINKPYTFIIYNDKDSIVYWNNNKILPFQSDIKYTLLDTIKKDKIGESIFLKIRRPYDFLIDGVNYYYNLEALIPLYRHYSIQNDYLKDHFALMPKSFSDFVTISEEATAFSVKDRRGNPIIYIKAQESYPYHWFVIFSTLLYFFSSFSLLLAVYLMAKTLNKKGYVVGGICLFLGSFFLFRLFTIFFDFPLLAQEYAIFNERLSNANTFWFYSLGDFLIDTALLFWFSIYVSKIIRPADIKQYGSFQQSLFGLIGYSTLIGGLAGIQFAMRDIVMSSFISFEFDDFSRLDLYSLLALTGIGVMLLSYFFISYRFCALFRQFNLRLRTHMVLFGISLLIIFALSNYFEFLLIDRLVFSIAAIVHAFTLYFFVQRSATSLAWISIWLMLFSVLATIMIENANTDKGILLRKEFSKALAFERDLETESTFNSLVPKILSDGFLKLFISNPLSPSPRSQAIQLLTYRYLDNYFFGRYDYSVHIYTDKGLPYRGETRDYEELMSTIKETRKTNCKYLQFHSIPDGQYSYFAQLPISQNGSLLGIIIIEFTPKKEFKKSNIYVELLSRNKDRLESIFSQFTYAVYKYEERVATNGSLFKAQLAYNLPRPEPGKHKMLKNRSKDNHDNYLVYRSRFDGSCISIVMVPKLNLFKVFTIFAYIFCFGIFLLLAGQFVNYIFSKITKRSFIYLQFENSLREQIQRGIIMVTLASFVAIAIITIWYYSSEYDDYHRSRLSRKISSTARTAVWQIHEGQDSVATLPNARSLADIHKIDVNIYDLGGNLLSSSEEVIFERHLISRKMNPIAFQRLRNEQLSRVSHEEIINNFEYISAYVPLKDKNEVTIAYLNLPYDLAGSNNIGSQDVAEFLGALLNVYVIFLLIAGGAAFFIANSVTNPLSVIGAKLDEVELGKKNEPLIWNNKDEIGELVERYNHMIRELEDSSKKLARSQRESAWREMAKQIAHEIKNPLTPMKLNIQLLERVVNTNPDKAQKMVHRVSKTLIEQIDSLAHIASEFSNFAKMPTANNEYLNINELVSNAYSLFSEEENVQLYLDMTDKVCTVFADKTQIMRVLNNLLKNAVQAIPDDQPGIIKVQLSATSTIVILKVSDNGCGIPKAQEDDIFVPNFTTKSSGTGIGLAMSKTIVEMAKGQIYFKSKEGKGTDFYVELPLYIPPQNKPEASTIVL
ncbi:sensor histidine kinase [Aureispira anguillae]|uniref:histidine kinase n=1 Tax=Aureispira anguillae TaxID=2864201 RepID=A0A916DSI8_9BACT|nr:HAMP domain-containing sensor histidine kinase [Aureispira anguillae]BDS11097.1 HAMP domain-containing histidine kinase [Aureispira anguillae]